MPNPIGERILEVLAALEGVHPAGSWLVAKQLPHICQRNAENYLSRAVGLGLATVDRAVKPKAYRAVPGWRDLLLGHARAAKPKHVVPTPAPVPALADLHPLYAVWAKPLLFTDKKHP